MAVNNHKPEKKKTKKKTKINKKQKEQYIKIRHFWEQYT